MCRTILQFKLLFPKCWADPSLFILSRMIPRGDKCRMLLSQIWQNTPSLRISMLTWRTSAANPACGNLSDTFAPSADGFFPPCRGSKLPQNSVQINNKNRSVWRCDIILLTASPEALRAVFILLFKQLGPSCRQPPPHSMEITSQVHTTGTKVTLV